MMEPRAAMTAKPPFVLIGCSVRVTDADNKLLIGISGKVIDETRNTLTLQTVHGDKRLIKSQVTLGVDKAWKIQGKLLIGRMEERLQVLLKHNPKQR